MRRAFVVITLLILITLLSEIQSIQVTKANPTPMPPNFRVESPQNNTIIYNTDNANVSVTLETISVYDYYYSVDKPRTTFPSGKIPLNLTITSENRLTHEKTYQCNIQLHNLTNSQHSVTLYYAYYDPIITDWKHILPVTTIVFSIDNSTPTHAVPEFPLLTIPLLLGVILAIVGLWVYHKKHKHNSVKKV